MVTKDVCDTCLENVEAFIIYHPPIIQQQLHANLEMVARLNVCCHHLVVGSIEQYLPEEFDGLSFGDITL